ncbi:hypothetical protein OAS39_03140 [Pirellulales bacterium]|nr:hypothetical protein [Pirellulales bacterium]
MIAHRSLLLGLAFLGLARTAQAESYNPSRAEKTPATAYANRPTSSNAPLWAITKRPATPGQGRRAPVMHELKLLPPTAGVHGAPSGAATRPTRQSAAPARSAKGAVSFVSPPPVKRQSDYLARVDRILEQIRDSSELDAVVPQSPRPPQPASPPPVVVRTPPQQPTAKTPAVVAKLQDAKLQDAKSQENVQRTAKPRRVVGRSSRAKVRARSGPQVAATDAEPKSKRTSGNRFGSLLPWLKSPSSDDVKATGGDAASSVATAASDRDSVPPTGAMVWAESGDQPARNNPAMPNVRLTAERQMVAADRESGQAFRTQPAPSGPPIDLTLPAAAAAVQAATTTTASTVAPPTEPQATRAPATLPKPATPPVVASNLGGTAPTLATTPVQSPSVQSPPVQEAPKTSPPAPAAVAKESNPSLQMMMSSSPRLDRALKTASSIEGVDAGSSTDGVVPTAAPFPQRPKIYFRPAVADVNRYGQPVLRPEARLASRTTGQGSMIRGQTIADEIPLSEGVPLPESIGEPTIPEEWAAPIVGCPSGQCGSEACGTCSPPPRLGPCQELCCRTRARLNGPCSPEPGIGSERVMHAISFIDTSQPQNNFRMRFDSAYNYNSPDRAEYFWAKVGGRGPSTGSGAQTGERTVDYQDFRVFMELGGEKFSVGTDIPIRVVDPATYANTSGLADINIITKTVFIDGKNLQLTQLLRTYIPSGDAMAGLGTGHASIEPGFAMRYKWSDITYIHADLKYWIPLGGDAVHAGEVLNYGVGISHVWSQTDSYAIMPTLEFVGYSFLDGQVTLPGTTTQVEVDPEGILTINPGIRWVWDNGGDLGVKEFGIFGGFSATDEAVYENLLRAELRFIW